MAYMLTWVLLSVAWIKPLTDSKGPLNICYIVEWAKLQQLNCGDNYKQKQYQTKIDLFCLKSYKQMINNLEDVFSETCLV